MDEDSTSFTSILETGISQESHKDLKCVGAWKGDRNLRGYTEGRHHKLAHCPTYREEEGKLLLLLGSHLIPLCWQFKQGRAFSGNQMHTLQERAPAWSYCVGYSRTLCKRWWNSSESECGPLKTGLWGQLKECGKLYATCLSRGVSKFL